MQQFRASIWKEGDWFVAQCLDVDVASQGESEEEALNSVRDAVELHFAPPVATITPKVLTIEAQISPAYENIHW